MQQENNKNLELAEKLDQLMLKLSTADLSTNKKNLFAAKKSLNLIDDISQKMNIPSLRALTHWMLTNTEETAKNKEQISSLCSSGSYFNWIEILSALLQTEDQTLLEELKNSLSSPNWCTKPSKIIQKELFEWIESTINIKSNIPTEIETKTKSESIVNQTIDHDIHLKTDKIIDLNQSQTTSTIQEDTDDCLAKLHLELDEIIINLFNLSTSSENVLEDTEIFNNKLEQLIVFSNSCAYLSITKTCRWCQRNLDLFSRNGSLEHSFFIETGESWNWLELVNYCINEPEETSHFSSLASELTRKEWLEPLAMEELQNLLLFLKDPKQNTHSTHDSNDNKLDEKNQEQVKTSTQKEFNSNLSFTWDEDIHPELLSAYFEETPELVTELGELLQKIANNKESDKVSKEDFQHASRVAHTIKGSSAVLGITALSEFSHKLEDILDYASNHDLPKDKSDLLSESSDCLESLFEAIQDQQEIPDNYHQVLSQLEAFANSLDTSDDDLLTLSTPTLPDFIQQTETSDKELANATSDDDIEEYCTEVDDIIMSLSTLNISTDEPFFDSNKSFLSKANDELQRLDLLSEISDLPEVSNISQWCQRNLNQFFEKKDSNSKEFLLSSECWTWIELISASLIDPDPDYLAQLSQELMRADWLEPIATEDLQAILLLLHKPKKETTQKDLDTKYTQENHSSESEQHSEHIEVTQNTDYSFSWDEDIHPELLEVYLQETPEQISEATQLIYKITDGEANKEDHQHAARIVHTIKGSSGVVGITALAEFTHKLEDILEYSVNHKLQPEFSTLLIESADCLEDLFESIINKKTAPSEFYPLLTELKKHADSIQEDHSDSGEADELVMPELPSFIKEQGSSESTNKAVTTIAAENSGKIQAQKETQSKNKKVKPAETHIKVPISVIDQLLNLAGELVTTTSQLSDKIQNSIATNQAIRQQDNHVQKMLNELTHTISKQEKSKTRNLASSTTLSGFDSLEMDTYNELHSIAGLLSEGFSDSEEIDRKLGIQLREITDYTRSLELLNKELSDLILHSRMVSINSLIPRLERIIRQTCRKTGKKAELGITGNDINIDTEILNKLADPLLHLFRNSVDHGIEDPATRKAKGKHETGRIQLTFSREGKHIQMELNDDGAGIDPDKIYQKAIKIGMINKQQKFTEEQILQFILQPGFTTQKQVTDISGRGVGMDVVNDAVKQLRGTLEISSKKDKGTCFTIKIPLTLVTSASLLAEVSSHNIAITADSFDELFSMPPKQDPEDNKQPSIHYEGKNIPVISLGSLLGWPATTPDFSIANTLLLVKTQKETHAIYVDKILKPREIVIKSLAPWINSKKGLVGACHLPDGVVAPVINLKQLLQTDKDLTESFANFQINPQQTDTNIETTPQILVVDDSLSNRKSLSLIIEKTEYKVLTAIDGLEALKTMNENHIDLVFTDLEMPRMNGLELTQSIRAWDTKKDTPVVMITSRTTSKHRQLAEKAGVNQYLTKPVIAETLLASLEHWLKTTEKIH